MEAWRRSQKSPQQAAGQRAGEAKRGADEMLGSPVGLNVSCNDGGASSTNGLLESSVQAQSMEVDLNDIGTSWVLDMTRN